MSVTTTRKSFLDSPAGQAMREELMQMCENPAFNTGTSPDVITAFVDKHLNYISRFTYIDPRQYILNLKMKSRV